MTASWMRAGFEMRSSPWPMRTEPYRYDTRAVTRSESSRTAEMKASRIV